MVVVIWNIRVTHGPDDLVCFRNFVQFVVESPYLEYNPMYKTLERLTTCFMQVACFIQK